VRRGRSTYASAFVVKKGPAPSRLQPRTLRAAWVDPQSVAGHLLPKAHLRAKRHVVEHFFVDELFYGSYGAALQAVIDGEADVAGVHVIPGDAKSLAVALEAHLAGASTTLMAIEVTADGPVGRGVLAYGQSGDPESPHHADGARAYADRELRPLRFTDADIDADPELRVVDLRGVRA
jgi:hypothetical protein